MKSYAERKIKAIKLRRNGYSYNLISQELNISKSTLSNWLKEVPYNPNKTVLRRIKMGPYKSGLKRHKNKIRILNEIRKSCKEKIGIINTRDLLMFGLGLYLGEGAKSYENVRIINSDERVIKLAINWLKRICGLENKNFGLEIHLYPDNNVTACLKHWSKTTGVPISQFRKTQIDKRTDKSGKKKRKLPYGTAHLIIRSHGNPKFGVRLHRKIIGLMDSSLEQMLK